MSTFNAPKGIPEYFPPDSAGFLAVRETLADAARRAGYGYIELPLFEDTSLFARGVGESTDVVSKEMYTFADRGGRSVTLRPEGTAGVMRSVIENGLDRGQLPVKLYYNGAFFRYERPQAGRYRQLQQVGVEAIGVDDPALDAEVIAIADEGYRRLGLTGHRIELTSLGDETCRPAYRAKLQEFLRGLPLDEATQSRAELNPLRVLDDKRPEVRELVAATGGLRAHGVRVDIAYGGKGLKGAMKSADRSGARFALVLGERELESGSAQLKDLTAGGQRAVQLDSLVDEVRAAVAEDR